MGGVSDETEKELGRITLPMVDTYSFHRPVLLPEVIAFLKVKKGEGYIDATLGGGGYAFEILKRGGIVLGIDRDEEAIKYVEEKIQSASWRTKFKINREIFLERGNFRDLKEIANRGGFNNVSGIIFDLGMSNYQIKKSGRGFSISGDEILDMRMSQETKVKASDVLNNFNEEKLYEIFSSFSEELNSRAIAHAIFCARAINKFERTRDLVEVIDKTLGRHEWRVLARIFQALRIAVNDELISLREGLAQTLELLTKGGRLIVLSYHSLEDRIVKNFMKDNAGKRLVLVTKQVGGSPQVRLRVGEKC